MKILTTLHSLFLVLVLTFTCATTSALASPATAPNDDTANARTDAPDQTAAQINITEVTPWLGKKGKLKVSGTVEAHSTVKNPRIDLHITSRALNSVDAAETWQQRTTLSGTKQVASAKKLPTKLRAGASTQFSFTLSPDDLGLNVGNPLSTWGARGLAVTLTGDAQKETVAHPATTFTTWYPNPKIDPTRINMVVPVTLTGFSEDGLISSADLEKATNNGALANALHIAKSYPDSTLALDPRVIASVDRVLNQEPEEDEDPEATPEPQDVPQSITAWWNDLKNVASTHQIIALPWADADIAGLQQADLHEHQEEALRSRSIITTHFPNADDSWVWLGPNSATMHKLNELKKTGDKKVILSDTQVPTSDGRAVNAVQHLWSQKHETTPLSTVPQKSKPDMTTVATSAHLEESFVSDQSSQAKRTASLVAKSALITAERPFDSRSLVVALPRENAQRAWASEARTLSKLPWVKAQKFTDTLKAEPGQRLPLEDGTVPAHATRAFADLKEPAKQLDEFSSIYTHREDVRQEFSRSALSCTSVAWRSQKDANCADNLAKFAHKTVSGLTVERGSNVLLVTGEETTIPVTIHNATQHTARLKVRIHSTSPQLKVSDSPLIEVPSGQRVRTEVPVTGLANADLDTTIHMVATDGYAAKNSSPLQVQVRVDWENIGIAAIGISLSVVFVVALFFSVRRGRPKIPKSQLEAALARAEE